MNTLTIKDTRHDALEAATHHSQPSAEDLVQIASKHTLLGGTVAVMVSLGFFLIPFAPRPLAVTVLLVLHVLAMKLACQLARLLRNPTRLWVVCWTALPLVNLLAFVRITSEAVLTLKHSGIRPAILGVTRREMERFGSPNSSSPTETWRSPYVS
jgi:hypothetical protein